MGEGDGEVVGDMRQVKEKEKERMKDVRGGEGIRLPDVRLPRSIGELKVISWSSHSHPFSPAQAVSQCDGKTRVVSVTSTYVFSSVRTWVIPPLPQPAVTTVLGQIWTPFVPSRIALVSVSSPQVPPLAVYVFPTVAHHHATRLDTSST